jgi:hypothetical protein
LIKINMVGASPVPRRDREMQIDPDQSGTTFDGISQKEREGVQVFVFTATAISVAANMCLQGGQQVDVSRYISRTATVVELRVALKPTTATLIIYSPGYEEQLARFSGALSFGSIPIAEPILCIKTMGGPLEFEIDVQGLEEAY